jgi:hypothetical protein
MGRQRRNTVVEDMLKDGKQCSIEKEALDNE